MSFLVCVPARLASSRLPRKALADLAGKPMVVRTVEQALQSEASNVLVATDSHEIAEAVSTHGYAVQLTSATHPTGTDRLAELAHRLNWSDEQIIVNVQGDEPLIQPALINQVAHTLSQASDAAIATLAVPITNSATFFDPNVVKVVLNTAQYALYFSRAPIPWARDALQQGAKTLATGLPALQHIGLYAYRAGFLKRFPQLAQGPLETFESLEQLRALENGFSIAVSLSEFPTHAGVDTEADLARVREFLLSS